MSDTTTGTEIISTGNPSIDDATSAFAAILSGQPEEQEEVSEAQAPDEGDEAETEASADESPAEDDTEAEPDDVESEEEEQTERQVYTVKVDGEEIEVPIDELLNGYSRTQDYTRKTQKLAEERKAAMAEFEQVRAERAQYAQILEALKQQVETTDGPEPDWNRLRNEDPIEFSAQWAEYQLRQQKRQAIQAEQQRLAEIQQREHAARMQQVLEQEKQALLTAIPEWQDPQKAQAEKVAVIEFGRKLGFSDEELSNVTDHRAVLALRKAYLYDRMMSQKASIKPAVKPASPVLKPGAAANAPKKTSEITRAKQRLAKTGSVQDAAAAFSLLLNR